MRPRPPPRSHDRGGAACDEEGAVVRSPGVSGRVPAAHEGEKLLAGPGVLPYETAQR
jgi:hypothetical protein